MKGLKQISFGLLGIILGLLTLATILERIKGTDFVSQYIYGSIPFVVLWAITIISGFIYLVQKKIHKNPFSFMLHLSFIVILVGAFTTWCSAQHGNVHLRESKTVSSFTDKNENIIHFPFNMTLAGFNVDYYPGTLTPQDFISNLEFSDYRNNRIYSRTVSMNNIASYHGYRFYQSGYDNDEKGTRLSVAYDPYGIAITYIGYGLLLTSMLLFFFDKKSHFHTLLKSPLLNKASLLLLLILLPSAHGIANNNPKVLSKHNAEQFCDLYVLYNGRICPLQTLAKDFTVKLYGKPSFNGYTPEQVLTGWLFYFDNWKKQPMIKIKGKRVHQSLEIEGKYIAFNDFFNNRNEYKLANELSKIKNSEEVPDKKYFIAADEKYNIIKMLYSGQMLKIYPYASSSTVTWYAANHPLPHNIDDKTWIFIRKSMDYMHEMISTRNDKNALILTDKLKQYQQKMASDVLPGELKFKAEKTYNQMNYNKLFAISCILSGLVTFFYSSHRMIYRHPFHPWLHKVLNIILLVVFTCLSMAIALRWYISNHFPVSNGFETMQFMAWMSLIITLLLNKRFSMILPFGLLISGLSLTVSMMGQSRPQITNLMPVLSSPLLSIHVVVIMIAYSLLTIVMFNSISGIILHYNKKDCRLQINRLHIINQIILYPAVFFLTIGICVGAVWTNISSGRYWGWDSKEVWTLITMLIYAIALHPQSLQKFQNPLFFNIYSVLAFFSVLFTYFGVNFLLEGIHSYAE